MNKFKQFQRNLRIKKRRLHRYKAKVKVINRDIYFWKKKNDKNEVLRRNSFTDANNICSHIIAEDNIM